MEGVHDIVRGHDKTFTYLLDISPVESYSAAQN